MVAGTGEVCLEVFRRVIGLLSMTLTRNDDRWREGVLLNDNLAGKLGDDVANPGDDNLCKGEPEAGRRARVELKSLSLNAHKLVSVGKLQQVRAISGDGNLM